jgi:hypothetical protein
MTHHMDMPAGAWAGHLALRRQLDAELTLLTARTAAEFDAARRIARPALTIQRTKPTPAF